MHGTFLGRFATCRECAERTEFYISDLLRLCTPWTPGVLELPAPASRVFPEPPGPTMPPGWTN
jgi:hypothetical protein